MRQKDKTTFTVASEDTVFGWDLETEINEVPTVKGALSRIEAMIGISGLERFIDHALEEEKSIEIIISNEFNTHHYVKFDPYAAPQDADAKHDTEFVLFMTMLSACLSEFLLKMKDEDGKATS